MKFLIYALAIFGGILVVAAMFILRPVPIVYESQAITEHGVVSDIYEGGENDVVFILDGIKRRFYINRGLENGLDLATLRADLIGEYITVKYPKYWTPLDWNDRIKHISKVEHKDKVIFNEFRDRQE